MSSLPAWCMSSASSYGSAVSAWPAQIQQDRRGVAIVVLLFGLVWPARITVMHQGAVLAEGTPDEVQNNEDVQCIYLGEEE